tara:strand:- start:20984 stop:21958 length:975 start_codon:yes stop_codon:yes gene_type:complete
MSVNNESDEDLVLIVDALNLFMRHFVAHPAVNINGEHVGGVVGFLYSVIDMVERFHPTSVIIVWEGGGSTRRRNIYSDYKMKRRPESLNRFYEDDIPDTVENRNRQITLIVDILKKVPALQMYISDCEADDVIAYLSMYRFKDNRKLIVSSDKDFYQLLDSKTIIYSPTWKKLVSSKDVINKFCISPDNFALAKSICGDASDNISGVKGVGFKTLAKRFPEMSSYMTISIDDIVSESKNHIADGSKIKAFQNIASSENIIRRNWKLIYLDTSCLAPVQIKKINNLIDTFSPNKNKLEVMKILIKEGLQTFNVDRMFMAFNRIGA